MNSRGTESADGAGDLADQARAAGEVAAITVAPGVLGAEELAEQIAVSAVELDPGKACFQAANRGVFESLDHALDLKLGRLAARSFAGSSGHLDRGPRTAADQRFTRAGAAVEELDERDRAALADRSGEAGQAGQERVVIDAELALPGVPVERDVGGARLDDAEAAVGAHHEPAEARRLRASRPRGSAGWSSARGATRFLARTPFLNAERSEEFVLHVPMAPRVPQPSLRGRAR